MLTVAPRLATPLSSEFRPTVDMSNRMRESRGKKERRKDGGVSRIAMGFAMIVIALVAAALLYFL